MRRSAALVLALGVATGLVDFGTGAESATSAPAPLLLPTNPIALSPLDPAVDASLPQVAFDAHGDAFAVWQERRSSGIVTKAAVKAPGGSWGSARTLAGGGFVSLAVDARGDALVAGLTLAARQGVFAVYRPAGGDWGRAELLSRSGGATDVEQAAAIDAGGRAFISWAQAGRVLVSVRGRSSGNKRWSTRAVGRGGEPALALDARGDALLVWHTPADRDGRFLASWRLRGQGWQRPRPLPLPTGMPVRPEQAQLTLDGRGNASVFWTNWDADVFSSAAPAGDAFSAPQNLGIGYDGFQARAAAAPDGAAAVAAVSNRGNGPLALRLRSSAATGWRAPVVLSQSALESALALTPSGRLLISWVEPENGQLLLKFATGTSAGHVSVAQTLATVGGDCWMHRCQHGGEPAVAVSPDGRAVVAWIAKADPNSGGGVAMVADFHLPGL